MIEARYVGEVELPWPEGTHGGPTAHGGDVGPLGREAKWSLSGMADDHVFYVPGPLTALGLAFDPVELFWAENHLPPNEAPYAIRLGHTAFRGLVPPLDQTVFACPRQHAARLIAFLDRVTVCDRSRGLEAQSVRQRMALVDWALVAQLTIAPPTPPTVPVEAYGVETATAVYAWKRPTNPWSDPLCLTQYPKSTAAKRKPFTTPTTPGSSSSSPAGSPTRS
jgi:hypothetical protein